MEAGWGEWKRGGENGSRVGIMKAGWGKLVTLSFTKLSCDERT